MYKKLRWKFLWVSTLVLLLVISAVVGVVYWSASNMVLSQTRVLMDLLLENDGELPDLWEFNNRQETFLALNNESINELRYYTAVIRGEEIEISNIHIAIQEDTAVAIAEAAAQRRGDYGSARFVNGRRLNYARELRDDGSTLIVLMDTTSRYGLVRVVMLYMTALWFAVLILYVILMGRYSGKLVQPFEENDERQKRFITNASHELKTPLAVISANTEMTEALGGKSKWTESTRRQVSRLQALIEDLVVLTRLDEMREIAMTEVDVSTVTEETVESFRGVIEGEGKCLQCDVSPAIVWKTEKRSFQQLLSILMDNAAKYCDAGGLVQVKLSGRNRGKGLCFAVSNTYAEGKDVDFARFFERFYREDTSHNSARGGYGIGLSMGKEIAERLGGKLRVSYAGDTITFTLELCA